MVEGALDLWAVIGQNLVGQTRLVAEQRLVGQYRNLNADGEQHQQDLDDVAGGPSRRMDHQSDARHGQEDGEEDGVDAAEHHDASQTQGAARLQHVQTTGDEQTHDGEQQADAEVAALIPGCVVVSMAQQKHQQDDDDRDGYNGNAAADHHDQLGTQVHRLRFHVEIGAEAAGAFHGPDLRLHVLVWRWDKLVLEDAADFTLEDLGAILSYVRDGELFVEENHLFGELQNSQVVVLESYLQQVLLLELALAQDTLALEIQTSFELLHQRVEDAGADVVFAEDPLRPDDESLLGVAADFCQFQKEMRLSSR